MCAGARKDVLKDRGMYVGDQHYTCVSAEAVFTLLVFPVCPCAEFPTASTFLGEKRGADFLLSMDTLGSSFFACLVSFYLF